MNPLVFTLILGTATPGGGFPVYGAAYAEALNAQEPRLRIETRSDSIHSLLLPRNCRFLLCCARL